MGPCDAAEILVKKADSYIGNLPKEANRLAAHAGRKTIKAEDALWLLKTYNLFFPIVPEISEGLLNL